MNLENSDLFDKKPVTWSHLISSAGVKVGLASSKNILRLQHGSPLK